MKAFMILIGILVLAAGLLFAEQVMGLIRWPEETFMIDQTRWVFYGTAIAASGLLLIVMARR
jgi:hypothetical protein